MFWENDTTHTLHYFCICTRLTSSRTITATSTLYCTVEKYFTVNEDALFKVSLKIT